MEDIELVVPTLEYEYKAIDFANEIMHIDGDGIHGSCDLYESETYQIWLNNITKLAAGESLHNLSPADTFFAVRKNDNNIIGIINIRHELNSDFMLNYGGHIGFTVRPSERQKGYATQMLGLALNRCRVLSIDNVLITCDPLNIASCKIIESFYGIMENEVPYLNTNELVRRYWIRL